MPAFAIVAVVVGSRYTTIECTIPFLDAWTLAAYAPPVTSPLRWPKIVSVPNSSAGSAGASGPTASGGTSGGLGGSDKHAGTVSATTHFTTSRSSLIARVDRERARGSEGAGPVSGQTGRDVRVVEVDA